MGYTENLCMNCFEPLTAGCICRNCGFDNDSVTDTIFLPRRIILAKRYVVGNAISVENDAVVYMGYDTERKAVITIREFLPRGICNRLEGNNDVHVRERYRKNFVGYKASFVKLWKTLKGLNSLSAVIPVLDIFEENETAYAVCEKMDCVTLHDFLIRSTDNSILWDKARLMFMPILTTIEALHENGIAHGAINPDNLVLCRDGKVRLKGFCIAECNEASSELGFKPVAGYTALEQYDNSHLICPATDIYAFSACIYRALVGTNPPDAPARAANDKLMIPNSIAERIPAHVIRALGGGLQIYPENRIQCVEDFRELLSAAPSVVANAVNATSAVPKPDEKSEDKAEDVKKSGKKQLITIVAVAVSVAVLAAAVFCVVHFKNGGGKNTPESTAPPVADAAKVTVPDFCKAGYTESEIKNQASWNSQFKITFKSDFSKDVEEGLVFEQSVNAGEEVAKGTEIVLTVSKGIETVAVPDVGGLSKDDAIKQLEEDGFRVSVVTIYNDDNDMPDTVRKRNGMAPAAGEEIAKGEEVVIQVYGETVTEPTNEIQ
ncbi:MAG: PASTA domain-containing protein [Eubacterium sp.]|nr:PASTA domain-containing protein [Eubacterium sp.]